MNNGRFGGIQPVSALANGASKLSAVPTMLESDRFLVSNL